MFLSRAWRLLRFVASILSHTLYLWATVPFVPVAERSAYRAWRQQQGCRAFCRILKIKVSVTGLLPKAGAMLAVCNHLGLLDPWILGSQMPISFVAKAEMGRWPVVGWISRTVGIVFVERERRMQTHQFIETVRDKMREGVWILAFPEGTTSKGDDVQPFKTGAFATVAEMTDGAVLPLYINILEVDGRPADAALRERVTWADSDQSMLDNFWDMMGIKSVHVEVRVGSPLSTAGVDRKRLARDAHIAVCRLGADDGPPPAL